MNTLKSNMTKMVSLLVVVLGMATATSANAQHNDRYDRNAQLITGLAIGAVAGYALLEAHHRHKDRHKDRYKHKHKPKHHHKPHHHWGNYRDYRGRHHNHHCRHGNHRHHYKEYDRRSYRDGRYERRVSVSHF